MSLVRRSLLLSLLLLGALAAQAQRPTVILVNGFDLNGVTEGKCTIETDSTSTFGRLEEFLIADGARVRLFDNCVFGIIPIEELGSALGGFIDETLEGDPNGQVDLVGFSMGTLIVRAYLSGKQQQPGVFTPPANPRVRKAVLVAGPHFGSPLSDFATGPQGEAMRPGSRFLWEAARWNQGLDDLRGVDAIGVVGAGGLGKRGDGTVGVNSGSLLGFYGQTPERTRVLRACHNPAARLLCETGETLFPVTDENHPTGRAVRSFLADTQEWRSVGTAVDQYAETQGQADLYVAAPDDDGALLKDLTRVEAVALDGGSNALLELRPSGVAFVRGLTAGRYRITAERGGRRMEDEVMLAANRTTTVEVKFGPQVVRVVPAAGLVDTLSQAPDSLISIYGGRFTSSSEAAVDLPLPTELAGVRVSLDGEPLGLLYGGTNQINALTPPDAAGHAILRVESVSGAHNWPLYFERGVPAIFILDGAGTAAAIDAVTYGIIGPDAPIARGGYVALYLTGVDSNLPVEVLLDGVPQEILYAGDAPGFAGLDQVNFRVGAEGASGSLMLVVRQAGRVSNTAKLAVQ